MLDILLMIILIIIIFIIILLLAGIKISFEYTKNDSEFKGCLKILILKKIKVYSLDFPSEDDDEEEEESESESEPRDYKKLFELAKPCLKDLLDYLKSVLNIIKISEVKNHLVIGFESFADTGTYIGIIWGVLAAVNSINPKLKISAEPSFKGSVFNAAGRNDVEIYPLKLVVPTIQLVRKKEIRALIRGVLDER